MILQPFLFVSEPVSSESTQLFFMYMQMQMYTYNTHMEKVAKTRRCILGHDCMTKCNAPKDHFLCSCSIQKIRGPSNLTPMIHYQIIEKTTNPSGNGRGRTRADQNIFSFDVSKHFTVSMFPKISQFSETSTGNRI